MTNRLFAKTPFFVFLFIFLIPMGLFSQQNFNMTLLGDWDGNTISTSGVKYNDIWGYVDGSNNEYAIVGSPEKVHFIDVTNPGNPTQVQEFSGGSTTIWRDFKTYKTYAYGVADQGNEGLLVFDLGALPGGPISLVNQTNNDFGTAHNIFIDVPNGLLYVAGSNTTYSGLIIYDLNANPINPPIVGDSNLSGGYVHDVYVKDNIAYCSHGNNGFYIWDYTNPANPVFIESRNTGGYNHSSWLSEDGNYAFYAEEVPAGRPVGVLDISDVANNGIGLVTTFKFPLLAPASVDNTPHNPFVVGDYLVISYYEDGVQIFDVSDPANPTQMAWYDTAPNNTSYNGTDRNWGVYPFLPSGNIIASDTEIGLVVLSTSLNLPTTCGDGIQNGIELGVDCGGYCLPCAFPPIADFDALNTVSCTGEISFSDFSSNGPSSWMWDFGDGNTSTQQNPTHTYTNAGVYNVTLTSSNVTGSDTEIKSAFVTINIPASPTITNNFFCSPGSTTLSASGSGQLNWYDGGGNLVNTGNTFTTPNLTTSTTYYVEDEIITTPQNFGPVDGSIGNGNYHGSSTQYLLFNVTQSMTLISAYVDAETAGMRTVELRNSSGTVVNSANINIPAGQSRATLNFNISPGSYQIGGSNMDLFRNSDGTNYPYSIQDVVEITGSTAGGSYYYYLYDWEILAESCVSNQTAVTAIAVNSPVSNFSSNTMGNSVSFSNNSTNATSWSWDFGDGNSSTMQNPSHTYASGTYTVTLTVMNSCGTDISTSQVTIGSTPLAAFNSSTSAGCAPLSVNFMDQSTNSPTSWSWIFAGGNPASSTAQNPTVVYNAPGVYDVTLVVANGVGNNTISQTAYVVVNPTPTPAFSNSNSGLTVNFTNSSSNATSYNWNFGDGTGTSSSPSPNYTYMNAGVYNIVLTATNACGSMQSSQSITVGMAPSSNFNASTTSGCAPFSTVFNDQSSGNPVSWSWSFPGGTPSTSTDQNPAVVYNTSGTYDVTLTTTNALGNDSKMETSFIVVNESPVAGFTSSISGNTTMFMNTSIGAATYNWDFGDTEMSSSLNPVHTYSNPGNYTVVLTATNVCGSQQYSQMISVGGAPSPAFNSTSASGCGPLTVNYSDMSTGSPTSWSWTFPGGTPSTSAQQNPEVVYNTAGTYDVILVATNSLGSNTFNQSNYINVIPGPTSGFTTSVNGFDIIMNNTSTNATSYTWDFGDGNSTTMMNPLHTYSNPGNYTVVLTATNACGSQQFSQMITIGSVPTSFFTMSNMGGCTPITISFSDQSSGNPTSWNWSFPGGDPATSTMQNPVVAYNTPGIFDVILTVGNSLGNSTGTQTSVIVVNDVPVPDFISSVSGVDVSFTNNTTNGASYSWDFGDGNSSTMINPSHSYINGGSYTVVLTATNSCGSHTFSDIISINGTVPIPGVTVDATNGCIPLTVNFMDLSSGDPTSWNWSFPGATPSTSTLQNPTVTYTSSGSHNVSLEVTNAFGTNTSTFVNYITTNEPPNADFLVTVNGGSVAFTNTTFGGLNYTWDFGDGTTSTEMNPAHVYASSGNYTVVLTATNGCGGTIHTEVVSVAITTNVTDIESLVSFIVSPNPNSGTFEVQLAGEAKNEELLLEVFDIIGQQIYQVKVNFAIGKAHIPIELNSVSSGTYLIVISDNGHRSFKKVFIGN